MTIADLYFQHIRERNLSGIVALFAKDATFVMPDGRSLTGEAAVHDWFEKLFAMQTLTPRVAATVAGASCLAIEIENDLPDGTRRNTANFFHLNAAGLIERLHVYRRG